jgi:hypothetical protein
LGIWLADTDSHPGNKAYLRHGVAYTSLHPLFSVGDRLFAIVPRQQLAYGEDQYYSEDHGWSCVPRG